MSGDSLSKDDAVFDMNSFLFLFFSWVKEMLVTVTSYFFYLYLSLFTSLEKGRERHRCIRAEGKSKKQEDKEGELDEAKKIYTYKSYNGVTR